MADFNEDVLAEFAALNTAVLSALKVIARSQTDPKAYLAKLLEDGLQAIEKTNYWSVQAERKEAFLENAKARYTDMITSIRME